MDCGLAFPVGSSRELEEKMIEIWSRKNEIKCQILRIGHVYGPGEEEYQKILNATPVSFSQYPNDLWAINLYKQLKKYL